MVRMSSVSIVTHAYFISNLEAGSSDTFSHTLNENSDAACYKSYFLNTQYMFYVCRFNDLISRDLYHSS